MLRKLIRYVIDSDYRFLINSSFFHFYDSMQTEEFIARKYKAIFKRDINLKTPLTFNEKLQWLKLYDRNEKYTIMVDKYLVKDYVANKIGSDYIIPTIGVWDNANEIDFENLPFRFVLKCNHNSGLGMFICKDKKVIDKNIVIKNIKKGLNQDYYLTNREWPYKNVDRKIIAEKYMEDESGQLIDYKIHCFNGEPKFILVCKDRFKSSGLTEDFYTCDWEHLNIKRPNISNSKTLMEKPNQLEEILELSKILSKDIPFLRVDFYIINNHVYFSELTFFPASGFSKFIPEEWDKKLGDWLELPKKAN